MKFSSCELYSLTVQDMVNIAVKSSSTLLIDGEIAVPVYNCYIAIDSDGTDLPVDFMTTISAHCGLYSVVHEISEGVTVLV